MATIQPLPTQDGSRLWVTFEVNEEDYCIDHTHIVGLLIPTEIKEMPNDPPHMLGVMSWSEGTLPIVDLRTLLGAASLQQAIDDFRTMRQMHLDWINALEDSVTNHTPFEKATDPHMCMFGRWYDNFHSDNISMRFILNKIGPPHERIHHHGKEVQQYMAKEDWESARRVYEDALRICQNELLPLLDTLIETFKEVNRGIVIVVKYGRQSFGLMADVIDALVPADKAEEHPVPAAVRQSPYISGMVLYNGKTYAALDVQSIAETVDDKEAAARELDALR